MAITQKEIEFRSSQELRESLKQVLSNPTLQMALEIIRMAPDEFPPTPANVHTDVHYSREFSKIIGTNNAVKRLKELAEPLAAKDPLKDLASRPEWGDYISPEDLAKLETLAAIK